MYDYLQHSGILKRIGYSEALYRFCCTSLEYVLECLLYLAYVSTVSSFV